MKNSRLILGLIILLLTPTLQAQTPYHDYLSKRDSITDIGFSKKLYEKAKQGDANAQFVLGHHYDEGYYVEGVDPFNPLSPNDTDVIIEQDEKKAFEWYLKAAQQGLVFAQYEVAEMLSDPIFEIYTDAYTASEAQLLAEDFYKKAAAQNCPFSIQKVCNYSENPDNSLECFIKSAEMGNPKAKFRLAEVYANGLLDYNSGSYAIQPNTNEAVRVLTEIAESEFYNEIEKGDAWEVLGDNYFYRKNINDYSIYDRPILQIDLELEQDYEKAFYYYKKIVDFEKYLDNVEPDYFYKLGLCYLNGYGVKQSKRKARSLIKEAAQYFHPEAQELWDNRKNW